MNKETYNELIEEISSNKRDSILELLDYVKNQIADARNGEYTTESRRCAIDMIDKELYNKIKNFNKSDKKKKEGENWI